MTRFDDAKLVKAIDATVISANIDGLPSCIPPDPRNRHYRKLMDEVGSGKVVLSDETTRDRNAPPGKSR